MALRPVVGMQAAPVEHQMVPGPGQHPAGGVVVTQPVKVDDRHGTAFDGFAGRRGRN